MNDLIEQVIAGGGLTTEFTVESATVPTEKGTFVVKYPTTGDELKIALRRAKYREGFLPEQLDAGGLLLVEVLATLGVVVVRGPAWFWDQKDGKPVPAPEQVQDVDTLIGLYERWATWHRSFRKDSGGATAAGPQPAPGPLGPVAAPEG